MFGVDDLALILGAAKMVPKAWELVAGLFGKETPKTVVEAGKLIDQVETEISSGKVTPEQQLELKKVLLKDEQVKEQVELERLRLIYQDQAGGRDVIKTALMSDDPVVRQARPKMMLLLGKAHDFFSDLALLHHDMGFQFIPDLYIYQLLQRFFCSQLQIFNIGGEIEAGLMFGKRYKGRESRDHVHQVQLRIKKNRQPHGLLKGFVIRFAEIAGDQYLC